jgi:hypothetical protein
MDLSVGSTFHVVLHGAPVTVTVKESPASEDPSAEIEYTLSGDDIEKPRVPRRIPRSVFSDWIKRSPKWVPEGVAEEGV